MLVRRNWFFRSPSDGPTGGAPAGGGDAVISADIGSQISEMFSFEPAADPAPVDPAAAPPAGPAGVVPAEPAAVPGAPTVEGQPPVPPTPPVEGQPATPPVAAPLDPNAQAMKDAADAFSQAAANLAAVAPTQPTQQQPAGPPRIEDDPYAPRRENGELIQYGQINIPDEIMAGMGSENPQERKQATTALIASVSHMVQVNAVKQTLAMVQHMLPTAIHQHVQVREQQREVFEDFYQKFPQLNNRAIMPFVQQQAVALAQKLGVQAWNPAFRDQLGEHVVNMLRSAAGVSAGPPQVAPPASAPAPGGTFTGQGARPAAPAPVALDPNDPRSVWG